MKTFLDESKLSKTALPEYGKSTAIAVSETIFSSLVYIKIRLKVWL